MGMYGAGKAWHLSFRPQNFCLPQARRMPPPPMGGSYSEVTNVTIKNGPQGFWGFMSGLFSGLGFGGGMPMGGLFGGFGMGMPMGMGSIFGNPMLGGGCFGGLSTGLGGLGGLNSLGGLGGGYTSSNAQVGENKELSNLKQIFTKHNIIRNTEGKYSIVDSKNEKIIATDTYEELVKGAEAGKYQGLKSETETEEKTKKTKEEIAKEKNLTLIDGEYKDKDGNIYTWNETTNDFEKESPRQK